MDISHFNKIPLRFGICLIMYSKHKKIEKKTRSQGPLPWAFASKYVASAPGLGLLICDMGLAKLLWLPLPQVG